MLGRTWLEGKGTGNEPIESHNSVNMIFRKEVKLNEKHREFPQTRLGNDSTQKADTIKTDPKNDVSGQRVLACEKEEKRPNFVKKNCPATLNDLPSTSPNALESTILHTQWLPTKRAARLILAKTKHQPPRPRKLPGPTSTAGLVPLPSLKV